MIAETRTATNVPQAARIETPATSGSEATQPYGKATRPKPTEPAQVTAAPAVVEPAIAAKALNTGIYKEQRFSDHAPLTVDYDY